MHFRCYLVLVVSNTTVHEMLCDAQFTSVQIYRRQDLKSHFRIASGITWEVLSHNAPAEITFLKLPGI